MKVSSRVTFLYYQIWTVILISLINGCQYSKEHQTTNLIEDRITDSIQLLIKDSKNLGLDKSIRIGALKKAYLLIGLQNTDSIKNSSLLDISYQSYKLKDSALFFKSSKAAINLSSRLKDTVSLADIFWNYGLFYHQSEDLDKAFLNYNKAYNYYETLNDQFFSGRMLYNMSIVQKDIGDYIGSEITSFEAIARFDKDKHFINLYRCYNNLGLVSSELKEFESSIEYFMKALFFLEKVKNKRTYFESTHNNLGLSYQKEKNYLNAIQNYNIALKNDSLKFVNPDLYAKLLDNKSYSRLKLGDTLGLFEDFNESLELRSNINHISGTIINKIHLSEYHAFSGDTNKAINYAKDALQLSEQVNNNRDWLNSLKLLSKLDSTNTDYYLDSYIKLSDSLQFEERKKT